MEAVPVPEIPDVSSGEGVEDKVAMLGAAVDKKLDQLETKCRPCLRPSCRSWTARPRRPCRHAAFLAHWLEVIRSPIHRTSTTSPICPATTTTTPTSPTFLTIPKSHGKSKRKETTWMIVALTYSADYFLPPRLVSWLEPLDRVHR